MSAAPTRAVAVTPALDDRSSNESLVIKMGMDTEEGDIDWASYRGTKAQLEAERVIPADLKWPAGIAPAYWTSEGLTFRLQRVRPDNLKGPQSLWIRGDWWQLMWEPINAPTCHEQRLRRTMDRAVVLARRCTAAGEREWRETYSKYCVAERDRAFQAFKAVLLPPRKGPGRPAKVPT